MYVRHVKIDTNLCDANTSSCQQCAQTAPTVFQVTPGQKAQVIATLPLTSSTDEKDSGYAIEQCPKGAIWGRGEGETYGQLHKP